jgi:tetratricopeptide (TPR) repeat protein
MIKKYILLVFFLFCVGCVSGSFSQSNDSSINSADRYSWSPADDMQIEKRRIIQIEFDDLEKEIETLFLKLEGLDSDEMGLRGGIKKTIPDIVAIDTTISGMLNEEKNRLDKLGQQLGEVRLNNKTFDSEVERFNKSIIPDPVFSSEKYLNAFTFFRKGNYFKSINLFKQALRSNPPYELTDNLLFGLGLSHYKLGNISMVSKPLSRLISKYPDSEKWYISHLVLALVHYKKREKSQALDVLEKGLKKNPPYFIRSMFMNLTELIQS